MTSTELKARYALTDTRTSESMRRAIEDVEVRGLTWRKASLKRGVNESGILRALRRLGLR